MSIRAVIVRATSLDYIQASVSGKESGTAVNPTANAVAMAFVSTNIAPAAAASDWKTASWDTDATTTPATYRAQCLVGPGGTVELAAGTYYMFVKLTESPEAPIMPSGVVKVVA